MKCNSIRILIEVAQFLFRKERDLQTIFLSEQRFLYEEMNLIRNAILLDLGAVRLDGKQSEIMNEEVYEGFSSVYWSVCESQMDAKVATDYIIQLKKMDAYHVVNGPAVKLCNPTEVINILFDIKYALQLKRKRVGHLLTDECDFFRAEKRILNVILDELGKKRYF
ncbi:hypothetical protein [Ammoniphilus sp. YIM 78166]|uniref:hypothetical protein n=1 Tax=Ammoniphilus sp. YIM 78166 TaxID=1644106 RepID=UPI00106F921D|nr:hypothetical protein [Ammoniphilus sp. YIM 78166]